MFQKLKQKYKFLKLSLVSINWDSSWEEEKKYLDYLFIQRQTKPTSYIYDSIFQYKAQIYNVKPLHILLLNIICFFGSIFLILRSLLKYKVGKCYKYSAVHYYAVENIPLEIRNEYSLIHLKLDNNSLTISDLFYLSKVLFAIKFNFIIFSSVVFRISLASYAIRKHEVDIILSDMEYSCSSGILHDYCSKKGVQLYNFMHGEKVLTLRDSFSSFDRFYVWDEKYKDIFQLLHTRAEIVIDNPWTNIVIDRSGVEKNTFCYLLKGAETEIEINKLQFLFDKLSGAGYKVYVKDHPRLLEVSKYFMGVIIIDRRVPFMDITSKYEVFSAQFSTVLTQCFCLNLPFYVDDFSNTKFAEKLKERGYALSDNYNLTSSLINESINNNASI